MCFTYLCTIATPIARSNCCSMMRKVPLYLSVLTRGEIVIPSSPDILLFLASIMMLLLKSLVVSPNDPATMGMTCLLYNQLCVIEKGLVVALFSLPTTSGANTAYSFLNDSWYIPMIYHVLVCLSVRLPCCCGCMEIYMPGFF